MLLACASPAFAQRPALPPIHPDITVLVGLTMSPARPTVGGAFGGGGSIVRFEIEYAGTLGARTPTHPFGGGISANIMVQSPSPVHGVQFYGIGGVGFYGETFGAGGGSGEVGAKNIGIGGKIKLAGTLRFRFDYRVFVLGNAPDATRGLVLQRHPQRVVVGLNFAF
jgi:hypothetical protein